MIEQTEGKIFPAAERGHTETDWFRSYNTFSFGQYQHAHKGPFGGLYRFNDDTLAGARHITLPVEEDSLVLLIPTVGAIVYTDSLGHENLLEAGQVQSFATPAGTTLLVGNAYEDELINFIQCWIRCPAPPGSKPVVTGIDLQHRNQLAGIGTGTDSHAAYLGKFTGRAETTYRLRSPRNGLFVFVLEGALEVQHRLLESRDGLALWKIAEAELEALSNDAIILLLELPL